MLDDDKAKKSVWPIGRLFPSFITIIAICFGLTSIRYALNGQWEISAAFIIIAGFLDVLDGRVARFLKATSNFGAQLDSLADFVNFGISPAIVLYLWAIHKIPTKGLGWSLCLFYAICSAIRLARFNSDLAEPDRPAWRDGFFTGVPAPMGAFLVLLPMMISFECPNIISLLNPLVIGIFMVIIGLLMSSRIPTFATKKLIVKREYITIILVITGLVVGFIIMEPWISFSVMAIIYCGSIPFSIKAYKKILSFQKDMSNNSTQ